MEMISIAIVALCFGLSEGPEAVVPAPPCPDGCDELCESTYTPIGDPISVVGSGAFLTEDSKSYRFYTCETETFDIPGFSGRVSCGTYTQTEGIDLKPYLPENFTLGPNGKLLCEGKEYIDVEIPSSGTATTPPCCRTAGRVGPNFETITITQRVERQCFTSAFHCFSGTKYPCSSVVYIAVATITYMRDQFGQEDGTCGVPEAPRPEDHCPKCEERFKKRTPEE